MEAALFLLICGAIIGFNVLESRSRLETWKEITKACGLEILETSSLFAPKLRASEGPVAVQIEACGNNGRETRIVVQAPGPPDFQDVRIRPEALIRMGREIEVGDGYFDSQFFIEGPAQLVHALLDAEARRLLVDVQAKGRLEIAFGEIRTVSKDEEVADLLSLLLAVRKRFAPPVEVPRRLAENAGQDPKAGVRLQNLLLLIHELPGDPGTAEALRKACSDPSPAIRLRAAKALGAEGRGVLLELAENQEDDAVSAEAVSALARELPFERMRGLLDRALSLRQVLTARVCMEAIARGGGPAAVEVLARVLEQEHGYLAPNAASALGATGSPAAEPLLISVLQREEEGVRVAAAKALGRIGSVKAVLPLKELADRFLLGETRRAARQAIAEIQSRAHGASPGQLSLAGAEAGKLSLAHDPAGRLSLGEDENQNDRGASGTRS